MSLPVSSMKGDAGIVSKSEGKADSDLRVQPTGSAEGLATEPLRASCETSNGPTTDSCRDRLEGPNAPASVE